MRWRTKREVPAAAARCEPSAGTGAPEGAGAGRVLACVVQKPPRSAFKAEESAALAAGVQAAGAADVEPQVTPSLPRPERSVGRNAFETILFRGLSTPTALAFVVIQSRLLEPEGRGEFVVVVLGATIVSRLLGQLGVAVTSRMRSSHLPVYALTQRAFALGGGLSLVGAPAMVLVTWWSGQVDWDLAALGAAGIFPNVIWQTISGVLLGQGRLRLWNVIQLLSPVLALAFLLVLVAGADLGVGGALAAWSLANLATASFALLAARDLWWPPALRMQIDDTAVLIARLALVMGAVQVVNLISYRAELFVLGLYRDNAAVGVYSIALQSVESMWLVPAAIATAVTAPVVAARDEAAAAGLIRHASIRAFLLAGLVAAVVGAVAPWLIPAVFGEAFDGAVMPLELLLPGVVIYAPVNVLVVYLSVRRGKPWLALAVSFVSLVCTVGPSVPLVKAYGATGAGVASSIGYAAGGILAWIFFAQLTRRPPRAEATHAGAASVPGAA